jgi:hypothetical protein
MEFTAMNPVNWDIVLSNIAEAREELQQLEAGIEKRALEIEELQIGLQHAYHHLNFAWNSKHAPAERHANLTHKDFQTWSEYPSEMNPL